MRHRFLLLRFIFLVWFGAVVVRLYYWQGIKANELQLVAKSQYERTHKEELPRGKITSSDGYPLAISQEQYFLIGQPNILKESPTLLASKLASMLFLPSQLAATDSARREGEKAQFEQRLASRLSDPSKKWVRLADGLTKEQRQAIENLSVKGLTFEPTTVRFYPESSLSAHVLGFVGKDNDGNPTGYFGIEGQYDLELRAATIAQTKLSDAAGKPMEIFETQQTGRQTRDITLTISRDIQYTIEKHLEAGVLRYGAKSAQAVIMEPTTGRILAMASYPSYEPSKYATQDPLLYKNPVVADGYEPGSTFKVLTVASGIDAGVIAPTTACDACAGPLTIGKYTIKTWNNEYHAGTTIQEGLTHSDNTAMVFVANKIGKDRFIQSIKNFGIGEQTGIDLQEESTPRLRADKDWGEIDIATASFGQGIALTMIQMLNAVNAIANDGVLMRPYVVEKVQSGSDVFETKPQEIRRVISSQTASTVATMMQTSASQGDARWTLPRQFPIAGKTGTAQIPVDGHYDAERTIASFVGFAPVETPKFTMLVRVVEPTSSPWGSETAAPLWFAIAKDLFVKYGISPNAD